MSGGEWVIVTGVAALLIVLFVGLEMLFPASTRSVTKITYDSADDQDARPSAKRVA